MCHHKNVTHDSMIKDAVKCEANMDPLERWRLILHGHTVCSCGTVHTSTILKVKSSLQTTRHLFVNLSGQYRYNLAHVHVAFFSSLKKYGSRCDVCFHFSASQRKTGRRTELRLNQRNPPEIFLFFEAPVLLPERFIYVHSRSCLSSFVIIVLLE